MHSQHRQGMQQQQNGLTITVRPILEYDLFGGKISLKDIYELVDA